ncbi:hypothetical protein [Streptomyces sp. ISL-1]|uniref:hypothetical protein n=1 Tax=Streptomyces sp. ISL-1 TaxID=2817657 RepID=UPI002036029A|nr:hypothetical protein [Streptomyces sp. ISL-1]
MFLQSRNGRDLTGAFPEIADAAAVLGEDVVIDGEAVIYTGGRLDFSALEHRMTVGHERSRCWRVSSRRTWSPSTCSSTRARRC